MKILKSMKILDSDKKKERQKFISQGKSQKEKKFQISNFCLTKYQ